MSDSTLYKLVNPEFDFEFNGETFTVRKATLDKAVQYQAKLKEMKGDSSADSKIVAFCIYIVLKDKKPDITEEYVLNNTPADINTFEVLTQLGFMNPSNLEMAKAVQEALLKKTTSEVSSS